MAHALKYSYDAFGDSTELPDLDGFGLLPQPGRASNVLYDGSDGCSAMIFRYEYETVTVGGYLMASEYGNMATDVAQTVVIMRTAAELAPFELVPEGLINKLASSIGAQDIDFNAHPQFSKRYVLRGGVEDSIRAAFTESVLTYLGNHPGLSVQSSGAYLLVCRDKKSRAEDIEELLSTALTVRELFASAALKTSTTSQ